MDSYIKELKRLKKHKKDKETYHIIQDLCFAGKSVGFASAGKDEIYRKFISDIADGKLSKLKDIKLVAGALKENLVDVELELWYA